MPESIVQWAPWLAYPWVQRGASALVVVFLVLLVMRVVQNVVGRQIEDTTLRYRVRRMVSITGYVIAGLALVSMLSENIGRLTVVLGGVGAGVAFALQEVIVSVAGWVALSLGGLYRVGDRVQVGGTKGDVIAIGILRTTLVEVGQWVNGDLYSGRVVRVSNSFVFKEPVYNYSGDFPFLWDEMTVPVRFGSDRGLAAEIFHAALHEVVGDFTAGAKREWTAMSQNYAVEDATLDPMVTFGFDDNWMTYSLRYVVDYKRRRGVKHRLSEAILQRIEASEGRVQLASATFEVVGVPPVEVVSRPAG